MAENFEIKQIKVGSDTYDIAVKDISKVHGLNDALINITEIAEGKSKTVVAATSNETANTITNLVIPALNSQDDTIVLDEVYWINNKVIITTELATIELDHIPEIGDIWLMLETEIPDRWVSKFEKTNETNATLYLQKLESRKVDLTAFTLQEELKTYYPIGKFKDASEKDPKTIGTVGDSVIDILKNVFTASGTIPTITLPSLSVSLTNNSASLEYGEEVTIYATASGSPGKFNSSYYTNGYTTSTGVTWGQLKLQSTNDTFTTITIGNNSKTAITTKNTYYAVSTQQDASGTTFSSTLSGKVVAPNGYTSDGRYAYNNLGSQSDKVCIESNRSSQESSASDTTIVAGYVPYTWTLAENTPSSLPTENRSKTLMQEIDAKDGNANTHLYIFVPSDKPDITLLKGNGFDAPFDKIESSKSYAVNNGKKSNYKVFKTVGNVTDMLFDEIG